MAQKVMALAHAMNIAIVRRLCPLVFTFRPRFDEGGDCSDQTGRKNADDYVNGHWLATQQCYRCTEYDEPADDCED